MLRRCVMWYLRCSEDGLMTALQCRPLSARCRDSSRASTTSVQGLKRKLKSSKFPGARAARGPQGSRGEPGGPRAIQGGPGRPRTAAPEPGSPSRPHQHAYCAKSSRDFRMARRIGGYHLNERKPSAKKFRKSLDWIARYPVLGRPQREVRQG